MRLRKSEPAFADADISIHFGGLELDTNERLYLDHLGLPPGSGAGSREQGTVWREPLLRAKRTRLAIDQDIRTNVGPHAVGYELYNADANDKISVELHADRGLRLDDLDAVGFPLYGDLVVERLMVKAHFVDLRPDPAPVSQVYLLRRTAFRSRPSGLGSDLEPPVTDEDKDGLVYTFGPLLRPRSGYGYCLTWAASNVPTSLKAQSVMILLVKHGGSSKAPALRVAQRLDEVAVVDDDPDRPVNGIRYLATPVLTADSVLETVAHSRLHPRACFTYVDPATPVAASVAAGLGLPGLPPDRAALLKDKLLLRDLLKSAGILTPRYRAISGETDLDSASHEVGFPCILKPAAAAYTLGVRRIDSPELLRPQFHAAIAELTSGSFARYFPTGDPTRWLLEEYLPGPELSIEVLGHPNHPVVLAVHEKVVSVQGPHFREDRFVTSPWQLSAEQLAAVVTEAARICSLLGFSRGVGNLEARLLPDGGLGVIELQTTPTGGLVSAMVQRSHGIDLYEYHARAHLQTEPLDAPVPSRVRACAMDILHGSRPGNFRVVGAERAQTKEGIFAVQILAEQGVIREPHSEYLGFVCADGDDPQSAVRRLDAAAGEIRLEQVGECR